ncbi:unnamed protein product [Cylindrotheca closterium]|uniref:Helicase ATP-binding domain-containing protein n=1 Tax=Cylindrotheca closterium TaxID=2856 RepID=A0AAD2FQY0_9STRA|nr:unnamed protein product [Cylindrotheca closterium]
MNSPTPHFPQSAENTDGNQATRQETHNCLQGPQLKPGIKPSAPTERREPEIRCLSQTVSAMTNPCRKRDLIGVSTVNENNGSSMKPTYPSPSLPQEERNHVSGSSDRAPLADATVDQQQIKQVSISRPVSLMSIRPQGWENNSHSKDLQKKDNLTKQQSASLRSSEPPIELPGEPSLPKEISFTMNDVKPIEDGHRKDLVRHASLQKPLLNGWTLFPHQKKSVLQGIIRRRMVLALDMGLGKTLIGCVWARSFKSTFDDLKVFIVSPVSLKAEWKRTAEDATGLKVEDEKANRNDESLDLRICSWAKVPTKVAKCAKRYVVVFDEAHSMQSMTSSRTKDSLKLVLDERCIGVLLLTGTPMKNGKPSNLFPLLRAVRHPLGKNQMAYEKHFCGGILKSFGRGKPLWDANGCANLKQLKRLVSSNLLHLTKEQCLTLPPLKRHRYEVPISHRNQLQYIQAVKNLASLQEASFEKTDMGEAVLGGVQKLRCLCSFAKVGATVELAQKILEEEPSVVIFTSFAEVAKNIYGQLSSNGWEGELLTGETPQKKRQALVDRFQAGNSPVFVSTFGAGGVGLTLTVACSIILLDRPWTPGDTRQAEDRIRRIGQTKNVKSYWMTGFELDKQIDDMIESKEAASKAVLAEGGVSMGPAAKINIPRLLQSLIAKVN